MYEPSYAPEHVEHRKDIIACYVENMVNYLKQKYPNKSVEDITTKVKDIVKSKIERPRAKVITYPVEGESKLETMDLLDFTRQYSDKYISPSGTYYETTDKKIGNSIAFTIECNNNRSKFKKQMFQFLEIGDMNSYTNADAMQNLAKYLVNAIPGSHGFVGNAFYDLECYNAVTSVGRTAVVMCYSIVEILISSNYCFRSLEDVYDYIINVTTYTGNKDRVIDVVNRYNLVIPDSRVIAESLTKSSKYYCSKRTISDMVEDITKYIDSLEDWQKAYLYYRRNLIKLFTTNDAFWRDKISPIFDADLYLESHIADRASIDPKDALSIDGDMAPMLAVIFGDKVKQLTVSKKTVDEEPEIAKTYVQLDRYVKSLMEPLDEIFAAFLYCGEMISNIPARQANILNATLLSDTDSIMHTVHPIVSWWNKGDLRLNQAGMNISAFTIWIVTQALRYANRDMSISRGIVKEHVTKLVTKYEFLYSAMCRTNLGKHYFGSCIFKEGRRFKEPELDIKGVSFQTSNIPSISKEFTKKIMRLILERFSTQYEINLSEFIDLGIEYEEFILNSIMSGELNFYGNTPIKFKSEYATPDRSIYFIYEFWEKVFAPLYGSIKIPGKFIQIPLKTNIFKNKEYLKYIEEQDRDTYDRLIYTLEEIKKLYPNKSITRLVFPISITRIPKIFIPAINIRKIIYKNLAPTHLALEQIGLDLGPKKSEPLMLDIYTDTRVDMIKMQ